MARIFAAAQYGALPADLAGNVVRHLEFAAAAASLGVQLLVFPELSLTGYELASAGELVVDAHDARLAPLRAAAQRYGMAILAGAPVRFGANSIYLGTLAFLPDGLVAVYTKVHLHAGERAVFAAGQGGPILRLGRVSVAMAICADIGHPEHAANAAAGHADVYAASVLLSEGGYAEDAGLLQGYARQHGMAVVMANHAVATGGWVPAGRSAVWDEAGNLVAASVGTDEALVVSRRRARGWEGAVFPVLLGDRLVAEGGGLSEAGLGAAERVAEELVRQDTGQTQEQNSGQGDLFGGFGEP